MVLAGWVEHAVRITHHTVLVLISPWLSIYGSVAAVVCYASSRSMRNVFEERAVAAEHLGMILFHGTMSSWFLLSLDSSRMLKGSARQRFSGA